MHLTNAMRSVALMREEGCRLIRESVANRRAAAIVIAPNGGRKTKTDHPCLPISPAELADCAESCLATLKAAIVSTPIGIGNRLPRSAPRPATG